MKKSNYELMRDRMEAKFLHYDQKRMVEKYGLRCDGDYLYLTFIGQAYRVGRNTGRVEWSEDDFQTAGHDGYNDSMTIFDVLCYAKDDCHLSGRFVPVNQLKGAINFVSVGDALFRDTAKRFEHRTRQLSEICEQLGGQKESVGDMAYRLSRTGSSLETHGRTVGGRWIRCVTEFLHRHLSVSGYHLTEYPTLYYNRKRTGPQPALFCIRRPAISL